MININTSYDFNKKILSWYNFYVPVEYAGMYFLPMIFIIAYFFSVTLKGVWFVMAEQNKFLSAIESFENNLPVLGVGQNSDGTIEILDENPVNQMKLAKQQLDQLINSLIKCERKDILDAFQFDNDKKDKDKLKKDIDEFINEIKQFEVSDIESINHPNQFAQNRTITESAAKIKSMVYEVYNKIGKIDWDIFTENKYNESTKPGWISGLLSVFDSDGTFSSFINQAWTLTDNYNSLSGGLLNSSLGDVLKNTKDIQPFIQGSQKYLIYLRNAINGLKQINEIQGKKSASGIDKYEKYFTSIAKEIGNINDTVNKYIQAKTYAFDKVANDLSSDGRYYQALLKSNFPANMKRSIQNFQKYINDNTELFKKIDKGEQIINRINQVKTSKKLSDLTNSMQELIKDISNIKKELDDKFYKVDNGGRIVFSAPKDINVNEQQYYKMITELNVYSNNMKKIINNLGLVNQLSEYFTNASKRIDNFKDYMRQSLNYTMISELQKIASDCQKNENIEGISVYCKLLPHIFFMIDEIPRLKVATKYQLKFDKEIKDFIKTAHDTEFGNMINNFKAIQSVDDSLKPFNLVNNKLDISGKVNKSKDNVK